jgi:DNA polymerase III epsilon subunit-like protein
MSNNKIIVFDTETTGFSPIKNEIVQLSYILYDTQIQSVIYATQQGDDIVNINGSIPKQTSNIHGITKDMTLNKRPIKEHIDQFIHYFNQADQFVGHNISFDIKMIVGQIDKIIQSSPEEAERYNGFLNRFRMVGKDLPDAAFCTMEESKGICAQIIGTNQLKKKKLMEVHQLLFKQNVGGQLHNALVDISVTLRVFLKLTIDIDICQSMSEFNKDINTVTNNNDICSLISPINIDEPIKNVDYTGELITGLTILPDNVLEQQQIMVKTIANQLATQVVSNVQTQAMANVLNKITPAPDVTYCTEITTCKSIIKNGKRKNTECGLPGEYGGVCGRHKPKGPAVLDEQINAPIKPKPTLPTVSTFFQTNKVVPSTSGAFFQTNKVVPITSGGRRKTRKTKRPKTRKTKKIRKTTKIRKTPKRRKTNKRRNTKKTRLRGGGSRNEDFLQQLNRRVPTFLSEQLQKDCDTGNSNLDKLKCNFTPDILEAYINRLIDKFNKDSVDWLSGHENELLWNQAETRMPHKFSCSFIRQIYGSLIDSVIDEWIHITKNDTSKTKGLGASYIRWVLRVTVRRFTNTSNELTKQFCDPIVLEKRDMDKYNCEKDLLCPSEEYLISRLHLSGVDENDDKWLKLVDSSRRDNETYNLLAAMGKQFDI